MSRVLLPLLIAIVLVVASGTTGLTSRLGAHPGWGTQVTVIGAVAGCVLAMIIRLISKRRFRDTFALMLMALAAFGVASFGRAQFVASYAEDSLAGEIWFYGWIAAATLATAAIAALLLRR